MGASGNLSHRAARTCADIATLKRPLGIIKGSLHGLGAIFCCRANIWGPAAEVEHAGSGDDGDNANTHIDADASSLKFLGDATTRC